MRLSKQIFVIALAACSLGASGEREIRQPEAVHARIGDVMTTSGGELRLECVDRRVAYGRGETYDADILSPKSAAFSPDGRKIYVNSLEGCRTVVYDASTRKKIKVIDHKFESGKGDLWLPPSGYYPFTHYEGGERRAFRGKPVEEAFTPDGRYLFVPYYRRDFDINAQDPSAMAVIDTRTDEIVLLVETGPLPKMVRVSNDGKLLAITHWGNNTVGFMDISDRNPRKWRHLPPVTIGRKLELNYSLTTPVNRDSGSGLLLRGTMFLPGDSTLLVSGMAGPVSVIDVKRMEWIGSISQLSSVRHIAMRGDKLYFSRNVAGEVLTLPVAEVERAVREQRVSKRDFRVEGLRSVKVGGGARTLDVSPSGKYIFVACNSASKIYVVDAEDMRVIGSITADSYPVGLDVSPDGKTLVSTSQGRKGCGGGNSVDFYSVNYRDAEGEAAAQPAYEEEEKAPLATDTPATSKSQERNEPEDYAKITAMAAGGLLIVLLTVLVMILRRRSKGK